MTSTSAPNTLDITCTSSDGSVSTIPISVPSDFASGSTQFTIQLDSGATYTYTFPSPIQGETVYTITASSSSYSTSSTTSSYSSSSSTTSSYSSSASSTTSSSAEASATCVTGGYLGEGLCGTSLQSLGTADVVQGSAQVVNGLTGTSSPLQSGEQIGLNDLFDFIKTSSNSLVQFNSPSGTLTLGSDTAAAIVPLSDEAPPSFTDFLGTAAEGETALVSVMLLAAAPEEATVGGVALTVAGVGLAVYNGYVYVHNTLNPGSPIEGAIPKIMEGVGLGATAFHIGEYLLDPANEYTIQNNNTFTDVKVFSGTLAIINPKSNSWVNVTADQQISIPSTAGAQNTQTLENEISGFNPNSLNKWWIVEPPTPGWLIILNEILGPLIFFAIVGVVIALIVVGVRRAVRGRRRQKRESRGKLVSPQIPVAVRNPEAPAVASTPRQQPFQVNPLPPSNLRMGPDSAYGFCFNCGRKFTKATRFCPSCGERQE